MSTDTAQPSAGSKAPAHGWVFRAPQLDDAKHIHALIQACPPLDVNSLYVYLLLAHHHSSTCVLAQQPEGPLQGFVSAYVPPQSPDVLFVWQVAVHDSARGAGLGKKMLGSLLSRPGLEAIRHIETTVGPGNAASRGMFASLARQLGTEITESALFQEHHFGYQSHEEERLLRLGPITVPRG